MEYVAQRPDSALSRSIDVSRLRSAFRNSSFFTSGGAEDLIASAALPGVGNVLERVADELEPQPGHNGHDEYLRIRLGFGAQT